MVLKLSLDLEPIWIPAIQQLSRVVEDIPNWVTLITELVFGAVITIIVYRLQSKTDKLSRDVLDKIEKATQKIDNYVEERRKLEEGRRALFLSEIREHLDYIADKYKIAMKIMNEFRTNGITPDRDWFIAQNIQVSWRSEVIGRRIDQVEETFIDPSASEQILGIISVLNSPFDRLMRLQPWDEKALEFQEADLLLQTHLDNVNNYLAFLSTVE
jgi:hypothetical protein